MKQSQSPPAAGSRSIAAVDTAVLRLEAFLPYRLSVLANRVSALLAAAYRQRFDLGVAEWRVMAVLGRFAPLSARDVASRTSMDKVKVSRAIAGLERKALLVRDADPSDQRMVRLMLSAHGDRIHAEIALLALGFEQQLLAALEPGQRRAVEEALAALEGRVAALHRQAPADGALD